MENFESQDYRDELAKTIKNAPAEARSEILEQAKIQPEYWQSRGEIAKKIQGEEPIDGGLGVFVKRKTLYHGTGISGINDFDKAEETTVGEGAYFTSEPEAAIGYARRRSKRDKDQKPIIYEANIENTKLAELRQKENVQKVLPGFRKILLEKWQEPDLRWDRQLVLSKAIEAIDSDKIGPGNLRDIAFSTGKIFTDYIASLGYDGLITYEGGEGSDVGFHDTYLIFDPERAKINKEHVVV
jgi:hypothetical protein